MQEQEPDVSSTHPPICLVHALLAANLKRPCSSGAAKKADTLYLRAASALGLVTPDMRCPLSWESEEAQTSDGAVPGEPLGKVKLWGITILSQYTSLLDFVKQQHRASEHFSYDYRRDLNESAALLIKHLRDVRERHGCSAQVVCHSMGCLIALSALHAEPDLFHSVLFAGGNFAGGAGFYPWNTNGRSVGLNSRLMRAEVMHTWPSLYQGASPELNDPALKRADGKDLFQFIEMEAWLERGERVVVPIDFYSIDHWQKFRLGPWHLGAKRPVSAEMRAHVERCLRLGRQFQASMRNARPAGEYPPVASLVGRGHTTPDFLLWSVSKSRWVPWTKHLLRCRPISVDSTQPMDGSISAISAAAPHGVPSTEYVAQYNAPGMGAHRTLLSEVELVAQILRDLEATAAGRNAAVGPAAADVSIRLSEKSLMEPSISIRATPNTSPDAMQRDRRRVLGDKRVSRASLSLVSPAPASRKAWRVLRTVAQASASFASVLDSPLHNRKL